MARLHAGLDVSLEMTSVCVVGEEDRICLAAKTPGEPAALTETLSALDGAFVPVGLEAGLLSQWLFFGLADGGRRPSAPRRGASRGDRRWRRTRPAETTPAPSRRSGWFEAVHGKSMESQELGTLCVHGGFEGEDGVSGGHQGFAGAGGITRDTGGMSMASFGIFNFVHQMAISVDAG